MGFEWKETALLATAAAGAAALLYYLLKDECKSGSKPNEKGATSNVPGVSLLQGGVGKNLSKDELLVILDSIAKSQDHMKLIMKDLMAEAAEKGHSFADMYTLVKQKTPEDPLEKAGISMTEFDAMLDQNQDDVEVRKAIMVLMGTEQSAGTGEVSAKVQALTVQKIRELHAYMLEELQQLVPQAQNVSQPEGKTIAITAQALVGAKVKAKFDLAADEVEQSVRHHHAQLAIDPEFASLAIQVQQVMSTLMTGAM